MGQRLKEDEHSLAATPHRQFDLLRGAAKS